MAPRLPKPRVGFLVGAFAAFVGLAIAAAQLGSSTWYQRFAHDLLQTLAGVAFALVGIGGLLRAWQWREWRRRTQAIAFDLLDQAMRQTAVIASHALYVLGEPGRVSDVDDTFHLPWSAVRETTADELKAALFGPVRALFDAGGAQDSVIERAVEASRTLEARADKLWELARELGTYLEGDLVALHTDVIRLHRSVRDLAGPVPGYRDVPRSIGAPFAGTAALGVLADGIRVAGDLGVEYDRLRAHPIRDERLRELIEAEEARRADWDETQVTIREVERSRG